jgi:hypothetical protein
MGRRHPLGRLRDVRALYVHRSTVTALQGNGSLTLIGVGSGIHRTLTLAGIRRQLIHRRGSDLALTNRSVVVLTRASIAVFNRVTGRAVASWRLPRAKVSERGVLDVERDYASFLDPAGIHVLRLTDGATAVIPTARIAPSGCKNRDVWAQMEPRGLV